MNYLTGTISTNLLISEPPLQIIPSLAVALDDISQAIVLQQLHYWLNNPKVCHIIDGRPWIYNSIRQWQSDNFPFWNEKTIIRILDKLEERKLIETGNYNRAGFDRTKWYTINYTELNDLIREMHLDKMSKWTKCPNAYGQNVQMHMDKMSTPIPETTQKLTTETNKPDFSDEKSATDFLETEKNNSQEVPVAGDNNLPVAGKNKRGRPKKYSALDYEKIKAIKDLYTEICGTGVIDWSSGNAKACEDIFKAGVTAEELKPVLLEMKNDNFWKNNLLPRSSKQQALLRVKAKKPAMNFSEADNFDKVFSTLGGAK